MKKITIFALLFLASCLEVTILEFSPCKPMVISDAQPVQFWPIQCETFNEATPGGVHPVCFCAPWQCDDPIRVQFKKEVTSPELIYALSIRDSDGVELESIEFAEIVEGVFAVEFVPQDEGICNEDIKLYITEQGQYQSLIAPEEWTAIFGSGFIAPVASTDATKFYIAHESAGSTTRSAYQPLSLLNGESVTFDIDVTLVDGDIEIWVMLLDGSNTTVSNTEIINASTPGSDSHEITLTATGDATKLLITVTMNGTPFEASIELLNIGDPITESDMIPIAKSDCLKISSVHDETSLIRYSNNRNFAGLVYPESSPEQEFYLRVPCRFFHELFPEQDEALELTSSVVSTSGQTKTQRLMEVHHVPYYFHKKLQLALKHQIVAIDGVQWQKEEQYSINEGNKRWPLKSATCLLTERNSVIRNVL